MRFSHLKINNQTYFEHFQDSIFYCFKSLKASCCFFIHAIYPDICVTSGSKEIFELNDIITEKYKKHDDDLEIV
jgi:hypothetical protein